MRCFQTPNITAVSGNGQIGWKAAIGIWLLIWHSQDVWLLNRSGSLVTAQAGCNLAGLHDPFIPSNTARSKWLTVSSSGGSTALGPLGTEFCVLLGNTFWKISHRCCCSLLNPSQFFSPRWPDITDSSPNGRDGLGTSRFSLSWAAGALISNPGHLCLVCLSLLCHSDEPGGTHPRKAFGISDIWSWLSDLSQTLML